MKKSIYNNNKLIGLALIIVFSLFQSDLSATHIAGGDIYYKCLGDNMYEITLEVRRDCVNGDTDAPFDNPASVGIFNAAGELLTNLGVEGQLLLNYNEQDTIIEILTSECRVIGEPICIERAEYVGIIELPFLEEGYIISYQRCCRSIDLINVLDPTDTGTTEWVMLSDQAQQLCNSTPTFINWPTIYACSAQDLIFDHSAVDIDGDSLVYKLCTPYQGATNANSMPQPPNNPPYEFLTWNEGFSTDNPLGSEVPLSIDSKTGILTGVPNLTGQYLVGVCVEEYRNGVLLSTVRRNFEYNIRVCINNPEANFTVEPNPNCESLTQSFQNNSTTGEYTWYFDYPQNTISSNETNPTYTFPEPGLYAVQLVVNDQDCLDSLVLDVGVSLVDDPMVDFVVSSTDCSDDVVLNFMNNTKSTQEQTAFNWEFKVDDTIVTSSEENPTVTYPSGTNLSVSLEVTTISGCKSMVSKDMIVESSVLTLAGDELLVCEQSMVQIVLNASDNLSYSWSPTTNLNLSNPASPIATAISNITYSVTATNGVCTIIDQISLVVSERIDLSIDGPTNICGTDLTLTANSFAGAAYEWFQDEAMTISLGTDNPITLSPEIGATTYYVALKDDVCMGSSQFTVNNEPLNFQISPDVVLDACAGDTTTVSIVNGSENQNLTFLWNSPNVVSGQDQSSVELLFSESGVYTIPVTVSNEFDCQKDTTVVINVIERPVYDNSPRSVCIGDEIELNPNANADWFYTWSTVDMSLISDPNAPNPIITGLLETTVFNVIISNNEDGKCTSEYAVLVEVPEEIMIDAPDIVRFCMGADTSIQIVTNVLTNIQLINNEGDIVFTGTNITFSDFPDGSYTLVATDINLCTASKPVVIDDYDAINLVTPAQVVYCPGDNPILTAMADVDISIEMYNNNGDLVYNENDIPVSDFPEGIYTIIATDQYGCQESKAVRFSSYEAINLEAPSEVSYCFGEEVSIQISGDVEIVIKLTNGNGDIVATGGEIVISELEPGTYTIMATSNDGCVEMQTLEILNPSEIELMVSTDTPKYCEGAEVVLTASSAINVSYEWYDSNNQIIGNTASITVSPVGMQTYSVIATNDMDCSDFAEITVMPYLLNVNIDAPSLICENEEAVISITNLDVGQILTYSWTPVEQIISGENSDQVTILLSESAVFEVLIMNMDGCTWTQSVSVEVSTFDGNVNITADPTDIRLNETTQLEVNQDPDYDYQWSNGETLNDDNIYNPIASPVNEISTYSVTVTNTDGCTAVSSIDINVELPNCDESDIFTPNMFSPNEDNLNDNWVVESNFIQSMELIIYNRWGEKVFESNQQLPGWDGTYEGELLEPDVYGYWLNVVCVNSEQYQTQGNITLMR